MNETLLPLLYDTETTGGWTTGMGGLTFALLSGLPLPPAARVLEVGCGSGVFARTLQRRYPDARIAGLDLNPLALSYAAAQGAVAQGAVAQGAAPAFVRGDLLRLPVATHSLDLLLALDSFDQVAIPLDEALTEARRVLRPGALLVVRVSAHPWLQGAHDVAFNTGRRYARAEIEGALRGAGFALQRLSYANTLLAPPVIALRLIENARPAPPDESALYTSPLANRLVAAALTLEAAWARYSTLPFGLSLIAIARAPAP